MFRISGVLLVLLCGGAELMSADDDTVVTPEQLAFFETHVRPVLVERCLDCHNEDNSESGLNLSSRAGMLKGGELGPALRPGKPAESLLISAIRHDEFIKMPPKEKLSIQDVVHFTRWVEMGAPWPNADTSESDPASVLSTENGAQFTEEQTSHWAFQPVADHVPPSVDSDWPTSPIDHFIYKRLADHNLTPAPPADKRTLIRRATYDLTGLPPTPEETNAFLADESSHAFARVIDRLLESPRYGERWGRHWLDVARYADSNGLDENLSYANAFRYRDYVISAFNSDKPYARFVQEQIAGDLLPEVEDERGNLDRLVATGFLALGPKMLAEDDPVKMQMDIIDEQINTLGQTFLGLTIGCARCHDHKFDPLPTADYYALAGIFKSSKTMENHNVVAVWYERPLASQQVLDQLEDGKRKRAEVQAQIDQFTADQRSAVARHLQERLADYLLAARELQVAHQRTMPRRPGQGKQEQPFAVRDGVAVIEAEAFHRGDIEFQTTGYGEGIGVVLSRGSGFVEFDVETDQPGPYQLELRFAAMDSRPVQLWVNGILAEEMIAGQTTGSWYPQGQRWFPGGQIELQPGKNTIRLYCDGAYPHIDRLVLVGRGSDGSPVDPESPYLSEIAAKYDVNLDLVEVWRSFLEQVRSGRVTQFPAFTAWLDLAQPGRTTDYAKRAGELLSASSGGAAHVLRQALMDAVPQTLTEVAAVYQSVLTSSADGPPTAWLSEPSPLAGPQRLSGSYLTGAARQQLRQLHAQRSRYDAEEQQIEVAMGVTEGTPEDLRIHLRGSHIVLGDVAPRGFPRMIGDLNSAGVDPQRSGRLQLAQWMTQPDHPLPNRVMVNRVWHWHFGRGLTPSVDNFGLLGQPPTHPLLLDWLTQRFIESGGSLKQLHRLIMLSSTWQMSTQYDEDSSAADPDNELLWRFRRRRLTAEEIRDSLISLGTGLDTRMGGSLLKVENRKYVTGTGGGGITDEFTGHRRSVYLPVIRSSVFDVLQAFDFPDPAVAAGVRQTSTVAPQALMLMNSDLAEEQTLAMARRLLDITDNRQKVEVAVGLALNRLPAETEIELALQFVSELQQSLGESEKDAELKAWQSYCRVLLSSNEFAYVE